MYTESTPKIYKTFQIGYGFYIKYRKLITGQIWVPPSGTRNTKLHDTIARSTRTHFIYGQLHW